MWLCLFVGVLSVVACSSPLQGGGSDDPGDDGAVARLSRLFFSQGTLDPTFAPEHFDYDLDVAEGVTSVALELEAEVSQAQIAVEVPSGGQSGSATGSYSSSIDLQQHANTFSIVVGVTSADGSSSLTYNVAVNHQAAGSQATPAEVAEGITEIAAPAKGATQLTLPKMPEGFTIAIQSSSDESVVTTGGTVYPPRIDTTVTLTLRITRTSDSTVATTAGIDVVVPAATDAAQGTPDNPLTIGDASTQNLSFDGTVPTGSVSYYQVTVDPERFYDFLVGGSDVGVNLSAYSAYSSGEFGGPLGISYSDGRRDADPPAETVYLIVTGSQSETADSTGFTISVNQRFRNEGNQTNPIHIGDASTEMVAHDGSVRSNSWYEVAVSDQRTYTVNLTGLDVETDEAVSLYLYESDGTTVGASSQNSGSEDELISDYAPDADTMYVRVAGNSETSFFLTVQPSGSAYQSDGTVSDPVAIPDAGDQEQTLSGEVAAGEYSYYSVPVETNATYLVEVTGLGTEVGLNVYSDSFSTLLDFDYTSGTTDKVVENVVASGSTLYISVDASGQPSGSSYQVVVTPVGFGTPTSPWVLADASVYISETTGDYDLEFFEGGTSYFAVPVDATTPYGVRLENIDGNYTDELYVYDQPDFSASPVAFEINDWDDWRIAVSGITPASGYLYIRVVTDRPYSVNAPTRLQVIPPALSAEGSSSAPLSIGSAESVEVTHAGVVGGSSSDPISYYTVSVDPTLFYSVTLTGLERNANLHVHAAQPDGTEGALFGSSTEADTTDEIVADLDFTEDALHIQVRSMDAEGSYFDLTVTPGSAAPVSEGTDSAPIDIGSAAAGSTTFGGTVAVADSSYYVVTVADTTATYTVTLQASLGLGASIGVFDGAGFTTFLDQGFYQDPNTDVTVAGVDPTGTEMYIRVDGLGSGYGGAEYNLTVTEE